MVEVVSVTVDVALRLPDELRSLAISLSSTLSGRMAGQGHPSHFRLGEPFDGGGVCEPHVSLFMLQLDEPEIDQVRQAVRTVAATTPAILAEGVEYRHNPQGAPELYFGKSAGWVALQQAVVTAVEPLRRGRLRPVDPAGQPIAGVVDRLRRDDPHGAQLQQLLAYGYDEIADDSGDRFNPHVTLAWPVDGFPVELADLPPAARFSGVLTELGVYGMSGYGTCTQEYAVFPLTALHSTVVTSSGTKAQLD